MSGRFNLPVPTADQNMQAVGRLWRQDVTGVTGSTITLDNRPVTGVEAVFKNGALLWPSTDTVTYDYTIMGNALALTVAATSGDKFTILAHFRV